MKNDTPDVQTLSKSSEWIVQIADSILCAAENLKIDE